MNITKHQRMIPQTSCPSVPYILLVEDNKADADLTFFAWEEQQIKTPLHWVQTPEEVFDLVIPEENEQSLIVMPKLILLDINLNLASGLDILSILRTHERAKYIPILILSSSTHKTDVKEAYLRGANGYIAKPVNFSNFVKTVQAITDYWDKINIIPKT